MYKLLKIHIFASMKMIMIPCKFHGRIFSMNYNGTCMICAVYEMLTFHIRARMSVLWILCEICMKRIQISWTK